MLDINKGLVKLGFAVNDLCSSQIAYTLVYNSNEWLKKHYEVSISLFYQEQWLPSLWPEFGQFPISETAAFDGILIATSLSTAFSIKNATRATRIFYIQDLEFLRPRCDMKQWESVMNDRDIKKFTRSADHRDELRRKGYEIQDDVIPSFEIDKILEIMNAS